MPNENKSFLFDDQMENMPCSALQDFSAQRAIHRKGATSNHSTELVNVHGWICDRSITFMHPSCPLVQHSLLTLARSSFASNAVAFFVDMGCGGSKPTGHEDPKTDNIVASNSNDSVPTRSNSSRKVVPVQGETSKQVNSIQAVSASNVSTSAPDDEPAGQDGVSNLNQYKVSRACMMRSAAPFRLVQRQRNLASRVAATAKRSCKLKNPSRNAPRSLHRLIVQYEGKSMVSVRLVVGEDSLRPATQMQKLRVRQLKMWPAQCLPPPAMQPLIRPHPQ